MYRASKNNISDHRVDEKEKEKVLDLEIGKREQTSIGLIAKQMGSLAGLVMVAVFLVVAIRSKSRSRSFDQLLDLGTKKGGELETLVSEGVEEIVKTEIEPKRLVVLKGELFRINIYREGNELEENISFDNRSLLFNGFEYRDGVEGEVIEERIGELSIKLSKDNISNYWGSLIWQAMTEGITEIKIGDEKAEVRVVEGFFDDDLNGLNTEASCSANYPVNPYNLRAKSGPGLGEISLAWEGRARWVKYGENSGIYELIDRVGQRNEIVIDSLEAGKEYYLVVFDGDDCFQSGPSNEVVVKAGFGGMTKESIEEFEGLLPVAEGLLP